MKYILSLLPILIFTACSSKEVQTPTINKIIIKKVINKDDSTKVGKLFDNKRDGFFKRARMEKVWINTYRTSSNTRVRSHFNDLIVEEADFIDTEYTPEWNSK